MALKQSRPAAVWKRILAFILDLYLAVAMAGSLALLITPKAGADISSAIAHPELIATPTIIAAFFYLTLFIMIYHVFCEYIVGQTPGMLLFGLVIKNNNASLTGDLTFMQALTRNLFLIPFFPWVILLWLIEPLFYVFQGERLLEYWTHTETVE